LTSSPRLLPLGDAGVVVEFGGDAISDQANAAVRALRLVLEERRLPGLVETVPTYRSLLIIYDPLDTTAAAMRLLVEEAIPNADPSRLPPGRVIEVPVAYGGTYGPDLAAVAREAGLTEEQVVSLHARREYRVYMLGFTPGFPYMGRLPPELRASRLPSPRTRVPARSVAIAGEQTGMYPVESPGGWRLLGRTPLRIYDPGRSEPFLLDAGDRARFVPLSHDAYEEQAPAEEPGDRSEALPSTPLRADLVVDHGGLFTTVQDLGRIGFRRFGVPLGGAMDPLALQVANLLLGNPPGAAVIEFTAPGPRLVFTSPTAVAVTGADHSPEVSGRPIPVWTACSVREGDILAFGRPRAGRWGYIALPGGIDVPPVLGSRSTLVRARMGGVEGRLLAAGDRVAAVRRTAGAMLSLPPASRPPIEGGCELRIVLGPQADYFTDEAISTLATGAYETSREIDRVGYRLDGPTLDHRIRTELLSDGLLPGAVQVPAGGQPIVIMADGPTTGGYPKIGAVVRPDLRTLAQARRGQPVRFRIVGWDTAHQVARDEAAYLASLEFVRAA
jgi:KipI family sensor histidine kinase inhibitor